MISAFRFILTSLLYYRRSCLAVLLGVSVATAVFTGAFLVGHSMRTSLRELALDAIGTIDYAVLAPRFLPAPEQDSTDSKSTGIILLQGTLENAPHRVRAVKINGVTPDFWNFFESPKLSLPQEFTGNQVILNESTSQSLHVKPGDTILVRLPHLEEIPTESLFGHYDQSTESLRLKVSRIIPDQGPGRFTLNPSQHTPMLAYVPLKTLQRSLDLPEEENKVNTILSSGKPRQLDTLRKLGLCAEQIEKPGANATLLTTDRMLFLPRRQDYLIKTIQKITKSDRNPWNAQPALTYLANSISLGNRNSDSNKTRPKTEVTNSIPYSTVTAYDFDDGILNKPLGDDEIVLNAWAAAQLGAKLGDAITLRYFGPYSSYLQEKEHSFHLVKILPMSSSVVDSYWTPRVPSVTDELTMANWNPPFPFETKRIRDVDEAYWDQYKATPKAFVSYKTGERLWGSSLGESTAIRITPPLTNKELDSLAEKIDPAQLGIMIQNVRGRAIDASVGTTSFEGLFIGLSFFVIAAALILIALMFRLGVDARARQVGLLAAVGFSRRQIAKILIGEGLMLSILGSLIGVALGILYAQFMIFGLSTWWIGAIGTPFLSLHVAASTLWLGFLVGILTSATVILLSIRRLLKIPPNRLLAGQTERVVHYSRLPIRRRIAWAITLNLWAAVVAIFIAYCTVGIDALYETLTFFGSGILTLLATLATVRLLFLLNDRREMLLPGTGTRNRLRFATRSAARHPMRSMAIVGMMAATVFLIVSIGAFRIDPIENPSDPAGPTGGFQLVGQSDLPIYGMLSGNNIAWQDFGFSEKEKKLLQECYVIPMRVHSGDNASCLNLFRPGRPQILSVPTVLWCYSGSVKSQKPRGWLEKLVQFYRNNIHEKKTPPISVAMEKNVANYSFQLWGGIGETFEIATNSDKPLELKVKALLGPSPFLGNVLITESHFERLFPDIEGYRFFLIRTPEGKEEAIRTILERALSDYSFAAEQTVDRMASVAVVQNTYLITFQSLGGLGLLLGLLGLLAVEVRNVIERRAELALLSVIGFQRRTLIGLLSLENGLLLFAGLAAGIISAIVAILPHLLDTTANIPVGLLASILGLLFLIALLGLPPVALLALRHIHARDIQRDR